MLNHFNYSQQNINWLDSPRCTLLKGCPLWAPPYNQLQRALKLADQQTYSK